MTPPRAKKKKSGKGAKAKGGGGLPIPDVKVRPHRHLTLPSSHRFLAGFVPCFFLPSTVVAVGAIDPSNPVPKFGSPPQRRLEGRRTEASERVSGEIPGRRPVDRDTRVCPSCSPRALARPSSRSPRGHTTRSPEDGAHLPLLREAHGLTFSGIFFPGTPRSLARQRSVYGLDRRDIAGPSFWAKQEPASKKIERRRAEYSALEQAISDRGVQAPVLPSISGAPRAPARALREPIPGIPKSAWASPSKAASGDSPYFLDAHHALPMPKVKGARGASKPSAGLGDLSKTAPGDLAVGRGGKQHHRPEAARRVLEGPLASHGPNAARRNKTHRKGGGGVRSEVSYERSFSGSQPMASSPIKDVNRAKRESMAAKAEAEQARALLAQQVEALTRILPAAPHDDRGKLLRGVLENSAVSPNNLEEMTNSVMQLSNHAEKLELAGVFLEQKAYFSALRCVYTEPELLAIMLNSIKMSVTASNDSSEKAAAAGKM